MPTFVFQPDIKTEERVVNWPVSPNTNNDLWSTLTVGPPCNYPIIAYVFI